MRNRLATHWRSPERASPPEQNCHPHGWRWRWRGLARSHHRMLAQSRWRGGLTRWRWGGSRRAPTVGLQRPRRADGRAAATAAQRRMGLQRRMAPHEYAPRHRTADMSGRWALAERARRVAHQLVLAKRVAREQRPTELHRQPHKPEAALKVESLLARVAVQHLMNATRLHADAVPSREQVAQGPPRRIAHAHQQDELANEGHAEHDGRTGEACVHVDQPWIVVLRPAPRVKLEGS